LFKQHYLSTVQPLKEKQSFSTNDVNVQARLYLSVVQPFQEEENNIFDMFTENDLYVLRKNADVDTIGPIGLQNCSVATILV